ncbi:MAG: hypothetical protein RM022_014455 [Nostoc sp. EfeVER01]|nr:hypothetical protein [Nostoc sp. EfeVER01]MDZ7945414.1 hypothetical protein [Nostoc sp. EfeVER01]
MARSKQDWTQIKTIRNSQLCFVTGIETPTQNTLLMSCSLLKPSKFIKEAIA